MVKDVSQKFTIRTIEEKDNEQVQSLIISVMSEYGCIGEGYSSSDPELSDMYSNYNKVKHEFYVIVDQNNRVLGCGGIAPLTNGDIDTCEIRKMYFLQELRGKGFGRNLLELLINKAKEVGFKKAYLETTVRMKTASILYAKFGFSELPSHLGNTGHCGCDKHMLLTLN